MCWGCLKAAGREQLRCRDLHTHAPRSGLLDRLDWTLPALGASEVGALVKGMKEKGL